MNREDRRKAIRLLIGLGFAPKRRVKHGELWVDGRGRYILVDRPTKTDDPRSSRNLFAAIRRLASSPPADRLEHL